MKRTELLLIMIFCAILPISAKSNEPYTIDFLDLSITNLPSDYLYPSYLADPLAVNTMFTYRDYEIDEVHPESDGRETHNDITIGTRFNFFRLSPSDHPELGVEMDWGMAICTFMNSGSTNLLGMDGIYYFAIAIKPVDWGGLRLTRHHICSHQGDQLDTGGDGSIYIDYDNGIYPNESNYVRDDYMISAYFEPLHTLQQSFPVLSKALRVYGDYNRFVPGYDLLGRRSNSPNTHSYDWFQYGAEIEIPLMSSRFGSLYLAGQRSHWQQTAYAPNLSLEGGIIFPEGKHGQRMRFGVQYYDGQSLVNNYQTTRAKFTGLALTID